MIVLGTIPLSIFANDPIVMSRGFLMVAFAKEITWQGKGGQDLGVFHQSVRTNTAHGAHLKEQWKWMTELPFYDGAK